MDRSFALASLRPTLPPYDPDDPTDSPHPPQTPQQLATAASRLAIETKAIAAHPYDPTGWLARACTLQELGFPELAVGDSWKADALCESMLLFIGSRETGHWRMGSHRSFWILEPDACTRDPDAVEDETWTLREALSCAKDEAAERQRVNCYYEPQFSEGRHLPQHYPWMEARHRVRSDKLVEEVNEEICDNVVTAEDDGAYCEVRRCTFGPASAKAAAVDASGPLGVFATRNIAAHTRILTDESEFFGRKEPSAAAKRKSFGHSTSRRIDKTSPDLDWIPKCGGFADPQTLLLCRVLLACAADPGTHPLDLSEVARLMPAYHRKRAKTFVVADQIATPNQALQRDGVDIFARAEFDTWVLFTVGGRLDNNSWSNPVCAVLSPLFSLFNHSCAPSVAWRTHETRLAIDLTTNRDIRQGEQLFVEYDGHVHDRSLNTRRKRLARWIDGPCLCERCMKEERAVVAAGGVIVTTFDPDDEGDESTAQGAWADETLALKAPAGVEW